MTNDLASFNSNLFLRDNWLDNSLALVSEFILLLYNILINPSGDCRRITALEILQLLFGSHEDEGRDAFNTAVSRSIFILIDIALIDGEVRELLIQKLPVQTLTGAAPVGREVN